MGERHYKWDDKTGELEPRSCIHTSEHKYIIKYDTGLDMIFETDIPIISIYNLCQSCSEKPNFSNLKNIISKELIKK